MKNLNFELKNLCHSSKDGSYATQAKRLSTLQQCANQLHEMGYRNLSAKSLKPKHIDALVEQWKKQELKPGTIKNNMTALRWWASKVGKADIVARDNDSYQIERRQFVTGEDKSKKLDFEALERIADPHLRISLQLQDAFGLRREESIKFQPKYAMQRLHEGVIMLKSTWTKGGKERVIPITDKSREKQLQILQKASELVGKASMIPPQRKYVEQLKLYEHQTAKAGLSKLHGLRHNYAQNRFRELTGFDCPAKGGISPRYMPEIQRQIDDHARRMISKELGHERKQIVAIYLGG